jgi:hypothetical protein
LMRTPSRGLGGRAWIIFDVPAWSFVFIADFARSNYRNHLANLLRAL